jgi:hypothetical protein
MAQSISTLAEELLQREMQQNPDSFKPKARPEWMAPQTSSPEVKPINPEIAALMGSAVDGFGTYKMLKEGVGTEGNPMLRGMFNHHPLQTGLGAAAGGLGMIAARNLLRKFGGDKGSTIANMLAGQSGADQLSLGIQNLQLLDVPHPGREKVRADDRSGFERNFERQRNGISSTQDKIHGR